MKVRILGCGGSGGLPLIGNNWGDCDPNEPKNRRTRVSILVEDGDQTLLVDTSPDMRQQLLDADVKDLSAILYTHAHADHAHGIDNIRSVNWLLERSIPVYANEQTLACLVHSFSYIFEEQSQKNRFYKPSVIPHLLTPEMKFGNINVKTFPQSHGEVISMGYRFNDFGYSTDASELSEEAFEALEGVKVWVVSAIRRKPHYTHAHLDRALEWIERVKPEKAYLTHMDHTMDYGSLMKSLPANVEPAYDGLEIEL